jgi:hypothetical protein
MATIRDLAAQLKVPMNLGVMRTGAQELHAEEVELAAREEA